MSETVEWAVRMNGPRGSEYLYPMDTYDDAVLHRDNMGEFFPRSTVAIVSRKVTPWRRISTSSLTRR